MERYNIYIGTDSNEAIERIGVSNPGKDLATSYDFTSGLICFKGEQFVIINIPQTLGQEVKEKAGLAFEPISLIQTNQKTRNTSALINALTQQDIPVAAENGGRPEFYKPSKYLALSS